MPGTYVTDLRHYLDSTGKIADGMPSEARQLASFLVLIIDAVTQNPGPNFQEIALRCRSVGCTGKILARIDSPSDEIQWHCPVCSHEGVIRNWQKSQWDQRAE